MTIARDDPLSFLNPPPIPTSSSPIAVSGADSYLLDSSQTAGSASGSFSNDGGGFLTSSGEVVTEVDCGFTRPDFRQIPLVGTVEFYERHVFLCYKNPQVWPSRIEAAEFDRLPRFLSAVVNARKAHLKKQTRLTICEGHDGTETSNGDVLIFPDMIRYRRLTHFDVETFVEEVLIKDGEWLPGTPEALRGWYIFVCCHGTRDRRCGVCGPAVLSRFKEEIDSRGLQRKVSVGACSHIGGDKYAGNVIIFGPNLSKQVTGHWYGYVSPDDVPMLIEQHIGKREIVDWLWRGRMGLSEEEQIKSLELRVQLNGGTNLERSKENSALINLCLSQESTECCQTNGSFACCQSPLSPEANNCFDLNKESAEFSAAKNYSKHVSQNSRSKGMSPRRVYAIPTWYESWEREDTYAALAVIGAVVSVAFAYNCYKQLR